MANYSKLKQSKIFCLMNQTLQQLNHNFVKHISYYQFFDLKNSFENNFQQSIKFQDLLKQQQFLKIFIMDNLIYNLMIHII